MSGALSPSNFLATNPELLRETFKQNGANLVRGMEMLAQDIAAGKGALKIRQSDASKFTLGVDMATTPGKVVFRNDLMELIQYAPTTEQVYKRPLLICPPWINKFYVLDLNPQKSFVRWAVSQGLTVFVISWVNPDERQALKSFEDYMREGVMAALDAIERATGERQATAIGYCVGGTLLAHLARLYGAQEGRPDRERDPVHDASRLHRRRRSQAFRRRGAHSLDRELDGADRLSRRREDGLGLQHAAAERVDLVLFRQQLHQGQGAAALRPAGLELRFDAHADGEPFLLSAPLLSRKQSSRGA